MKPTGTPSAKLTYDDFCHFPDDGKRHEIIDGEHYVTPSPNIKHQTVVGHLSHALHEYLKKQSVGAVFVAPCDVVLSEHDVVEPDLLYISRARAGIVTELNVQGPPDLVVEILSPTTRRTDEVVKRKRYERFGVEEYWIIDPELETVRLFRRVEGRLDRVAELAADHGDALTTPLLPGFTLTLTTVFTPAF